MMENSIGSIVQKRAEHFENSTKLDTPFGKTVLSLRWSNINQNSDVLGEGTHSIVRKVTLQGHPETFALKVLNHDLKRMNEQRYTQAAIDIVMEGNILGRLDHPNIIGLRGIRKGKVAQNVDNGSYFLLLEYLPKVLDEVLRKKRNSTKGKITNSVKTKLFDRLEFCAFGVARAMEYLHERGIIFRDLKPSNVGFDEDDNVKLFDLGNCRELAYSTAIGEKLGFAGTPRYMAPEVWAGKEYGLPSDVYSFGIVLWEIATLRVPFEDVVSIEAFKWEVVQQHKRPNLLHVKSEELRNLISLCWDPEPSRRPTFAQVRQELERLLIGQKGKATRRRSRTFSSGSLGSLNGNNQSQLGTSPSGLFSGSLSRFGTSPSMIVGPQMDVNSGSPPENFSGLSFSNEKLQRKHRNFSWGKFSGGSGEFVDDS